VTSGWEHFAEWKRQDESEKGSVEAEVLLNGMLAHERLLDIVENFILFDSSKPGGTRKIVGLNHQVLGVNNAVASVRRQEALRREFPVEKRLTYHSVELPVKELADEDLLPLAKLEERDITKLMLQWVESAHPDLGKLGGVLAHARERQVVFNGVLRRESAPAHFREVYFLADDRPQRLGRADLQDIRRV